MAAGVERDIVSKVLQVVGRQQLLVKTLFLLLGSMSAVPCPARSLLCHTTASSHFQSTLRGARPCTSPRVDSRGHQKKTLRNITAASSASADGKASKEYAPGSNRVSSSSRSSCAGQGVPGVYQQLPASFWDERRILYNRMRHERDRVSRRARLRELRAKEEAYLALLPASARSAYEVQMTELRIAAAKQQKAVLAHALQHGLRVVIDCSYCLPAATAWDSSIRRSSGNDSCSNNIGNTEPALPHTIQEQLQLLTDQQPKPGDPQHYLQQPSTQQHWSQQNLYNKQCEQMTGCQQRQQQCRGHAGIDQVIDHAAAAWQRAGDDASKEVRSLAKQIELSVSLNRRSSQPVALTVTSFTGHLQTFALHMGAHRWPLNKHAGHVLDMYAAEDLVVLSPDADEPLLTLHPAKVYVIGGIVDRSVCKGLTAGFGSRHALQTVRLPVAENAEELGMGYAGASTRPVLNVSDVVVALVEYQRTGDWVHALREAVPARKRRNKQSSQQCKNEQYIGSM